MDLNRTETEDDSSGTGGESEIKTEFIVKCSKCRFWCSDPKYIKLHDEIEHGTNQLLRNNETTDLTSHPAVKKFKTSSQPKAENVEEIIKIAHSLMGQLYGLLLDSNSKLADEVNEKPEINDQVSLSALFYIDFNLHLICKT